MYRFAQLGLFVFVLALTAGERQAEGQTSDSTQGTARLRLAAKKLDSPPQTRRETQEELDARVRELEKQLANLSEKEIKAERKALRKPSIRVTGRIMTDWVHYGQDAANEATIGSLMNGAEFRRTRLGIKGRLFETTFYEWELDFSDGAIEYKDLYIGMDDLGCSGTVVVGHFKEPFSFDELTSSKYFSLLERALPNVFAPSRALGAAYYHISDNELMTFAIGTFNTTLMEETGGFQDDNGGQDVTTRLTWLPYYDEPSEGRYLVHLGANYSFREIADDIVQYRQRPEANGTSAFVARVYVNGENVMRA
jgi:phosphate-selective porin OprO/OprP